MPPPPDPSPEPESKRRRLDVKERHVANATTDVSIVKTTMNTFMTQEARALPLAEMLIDMNKMVVEAYALANVHVLRVCQLQRDPPSALESQDTRDANPPLEELNQTYFRRCLAAVAMAPRGSESFLQSYELYDSWRDSDAARARGTLSYGWMDNAARQMTTNTQHAVSANFYRRFHKQLKRCYDMDGREAYVMLKAILEPEYEGDDCEVLAWRQHVPRTASGRLDNRAHRLLPLTFSFLSDIENWNLRFDGEQRYKPLRSFSLLPFKQGFVSQYFTMCNSGLHALLKRAGIAVPPRREWTSEADAWWRSLFNVSKFETATRTFAGQIETDGHAVSIIMRKPKRDTVIKSLKESDYDVMWGLDPGRRDLFVATNQHGDTTRCSTREFYEDAFYTKSNQAIKIWQNKRRDVRDAIRGMPTKKTASLDHLEAYVRFLTAHMDLSLEFARVKPFRKLKLRRYVGAQKKLRALCLMLTAQAGRRTVVGFGDWSNIEQGGLIKRCPAGPVKRLERELKRYCRVVLIDEFKTSKLHAACSGEMRHQYSERKCKDGVKRTVKIHSVLYCRSNGCHGTNVNRDANASLNMLMLLVECEFRGCPRPPAFSRSM